MIEQQVFSLTDGLLHTNIFTDAINETYESVAGGDDDNWGEPYLVYRENHRGEYIIDVDGIDETCEIECAFIADGYMFAFFRSEHSDGDDIVYGLVRLTVNQDATELEHKLIDEQFKRHLKFWFDFDEQSSIKLHNMLRFYKRETTKIGETE